MVSRLIVSAAILTAVTGCSARYIRSASAPPVVQIPATSMSRHVVVVSIDGLRPDAIQAYGAATMQRLIREGSSTLSGRTIDPSKTLPSHTSMLTGQLPERHGVLWNTVATAKAESIELPNMFGLARAQGYTTAAFFSKPKFQPLQVDGDARLLAGAGRLVRRMVGQTHGEGRREVPRDRPPERALRASHRS